MKTKKIITYKTILWFKKKKGELQLHRTLGDFWLLTKVISLNIYLYFGKLKKRNCKKKLNNVIYYTIKKNVYFYCDTNNHIRIPLPLFMQGHTFHAVKTNGQRWEVDSRWGSEIVIRGR